MLEHDPDGFSVVTRPQQLASNAVWSEEQARSWIEYAVMAPSVHNSQPWRFRIRDRAIDVHVDPTRLLSGVDPDGIEQRISCGAAICNLELAMQAAGWQPVTTVLPHPANPAFLATVAVGDSSPVSDATRTLFGAIAHRHTSREPFLETVVGPEIRAELVAVAQTDATWLFLTDRSVEVEELARFIRGANRIQCEDPTVSAELTEWSGDRGDKPDGVSPKAAGSALFGSELLPFRGFAGDSGLPRVRRRPTAVPLLGVLAARGYGPRYDVLAGIALQRVLLTATARSLTASFFPQALEVQGMAGPFTAAVTMMARRSGVPRMVLRLGYAPFRVATARRDIDEVIF